MTAVTRAVGQCKGRYDERSSRQPTRVNFDEMMPHWGESCILITFWKFHTCHKVERSLPVCTWYRV